MRSSSCFWICVTRRLVASMRLRASSSSKSAARAESEKQNPTSANVASAPLTPALSRRTGRGSRGSLTDIHDIDAAVLGPRRLVMSLAARLFLAEADRLALDLLRTEQHHQFLDRIGAFLAKRDVVFA